MGMSMIEEDIEIRDSLNNKAQTTVSDAIETLTTTTTTGRKRKNWSFDLIKSYLDEVSKIPLLTLAEEIEATWAVFNGKTALQSLAENELGIDTNLLKLILLEKAVDISLLLPYITEELKKFTDEDIKEAKRAIQPKNLTKRQKRLLNMAIEGMTARNLLLKSNVRLVISIAKRYTRRGMELSDLIQEGNLGLMKAVEKFDPQRRFKFSTYATWWIRQSINRAIADQSRTIRLPVHVVETLNKMGKVVADLRQSMGANPVPRQIANAMGEGWTTKKVENMLSLINPPMSLEEPVGDSAHMRETTLGDLIENTNIKTPDEIIEDIRLREVLNEMLNQLDYLEKYVLSARFGLLDGRSHTLEEIGTYAGVTRERIRQIEAKAMRKLKALNAPSKILSLFL